MLPTFSFLLAATLLAIIPGPGVAYVVARTVAGGTAEGITTTVGLTLGGMVHVLAAALGLSVLIAQSAMAFTVLKYLGAAYLVYLGIKTILSRPEASGSPAIKRAGPAKALRDGIIVETLNVKTAMFFLAFIPQFVSVQQAMAPQFILLGSICVLLNSTVDLIAVFAASRIVSTGVAKAAKERLLCRLSGTTMMTLGVLVAIANREA
ncbi:LysE family translocator [Chromohalobacter sp. HP20-39]|uniref:LysE family translocator n=1 Tax=Chromohalobacter sp. HP20-39 TaxID=3079306 RepID=UPI00294B66A7|nr:LysE family translocator [Chromohalobacter sp. HP20-39]MDV6319840.1 LysE family translocator [Chromohalobacter sp. HP20-39]